MNIEITHKLQQSAVADEIPDPPPGNDEFAEDEQVQPSYRQVITWCVLFGIPVSFTLLFLNLYLLQFGAISDITVSLGARVMLAFDGAPPRLENIGGIYPPVPFFFSLLLRNQLLATSLVGGFFLACCLWFLHSLRRQGSINTIMEYGCVIYLLFLPQTLYILSQRIDIVLVLFLFSAAFLNLRKVQVHGRAYHMTIAGLAMAMLFLSDYSAISFCLLFLPLLILQSRRAGDSTTATALMLYLPLFFFALVQFPLSVLFTGASDPFREWHDLLLSAYGLHDTIWFSRKDLNEWLPFLLSRLAGKVEFLVPWMAAGLLLFLRPSKPQPSVYLFYFTAPLLYFLSSLVLGTPHFLMDNASYLIFPLVTFLLLHPDFGRELRSKKAANLVLVTALAISLAGGYHKAATTQDPMERKFYEAIWHGKSDQEWLQTLALANTLNDLDNPGKILMDSRQNLPLIFISGTPKRFLLPYQLDFEIGLSLPAAYVDNVVVNTASARDVVARRYPQSREGRLPGFKLIGKYGPRLLFQRIAASV